MNEIWMNVQLLYLSELAILKNTKKQRIFLLRLGLFRAWPNGNLKDYHNDILYIAYEKAEYIASISPFQSTQNYNIFIFSNKI